MTTSKTVRHTTEGVKTYAPTQPPTISPHGLFASGRLSLSALGVLAYLYSFHPHGRTVAEVIEDCPVDDEATITAALDELLDADLIA